MAVEIITSLVRQFLSSGAVNNAGSVEVYDVGTTTPRAIYSDTALSSSATNPITLDSGGMHAMRYTATGSYKIVVKDADGNTVYTKDNIDGRVPVGGGALAVASGGTGATTAGGARTNLGAYAASSGATVESDLANLQAWAGYNLTTKSRMATGTTVQQPSAGTAGAHRFDTTLGLPLVDNGSAFKKIAIEGKLDYTYYAASSGSYVIKRSRTVLSSTQSITATIPADNTKPQIGEGTQITNASVSFTPLRSDTTIRIRAKITGAASNLTTVNTVAMFIDGASDAVAADAAYVNSAVVGTWQIHLDYEYTPGSTNAITVALRAGPGSGTMYINTDSSGTPITLGGLRVSYLLIEEVYTP